MEDAGKAALLRQTDFTFLVRSCVCTWWDWRQILHQRELQIGLGSEVSQRDDGFVKEVRSPGKSCALFSELSGAEHPGVTPTSSWYRMPLVTHTGDTSGSLPSVVFRISVLITHFRFIQPHLLLIF